MIDVLLIQPPMGSTDLPSLGLSTLKAILRSDKISVSIFYSNFLFSELIGSELYRKISLVNVTSFLGELIFASQAFPSSQEKHENYLNLLENKSISVPLLKSTLTSDDVLAAEKKVDLFLKRVIKIILEKNPKIIGFSSLFHQICSSIAIANRIKAIKPEIITLMGGSNCFEPMGHALAEVSPSIDFLFTGEADKTLVNFCNQYLKENRLPKQKIIPCEMFEDLDSLPYPDYDDYFQVERAKDEFSSRLCFESSRGCWWGEKKHCLFCGLNGQNIKYRHKSYGRIFDEINYLAKKYPQATELQATDNIMPKDLAKKIFYDSKTVEKIERIYYEVKPFLSIEEMYFLRARKVNCFQPGLESLNDNLLKLLNKGLTGSGNIRFLRDCKNLGISIDWNILYAIPGERIEDYEEMLDIFPSIYHLQPPAYLGSINVQRYSPLYCDYKKYGLEEIHPIKEYSYIFPNETNLEDLGLYFEHKFQTVFDDKIKRTFNDSLDRWRNLWTKEGMPELLLLELSNDAFVITDTRPMATKIRTVINKNEYELLKCFRNPVTENLLEEILQRFGKTVFKKFIANKWIIQCGTRYIMLITELNRLVELKKEYLK